MTTAFNTLPSALILSVSVKQLVVLLYRTWARHMWHFESQWGSICVVFCDAVPLSANTGMSSVCSVQNVCDVLLCY